METKDTMLMSNWAVKWMHEMKKEGWTRNRAEIQTEEMIKRVKRFAMRHGIGTTELIQELTTRAFITPQAERTWEFRFDKIKVRER